MFGSEVAEIGVAEGHVLGDTGFARSIGSVEVFADDLLRVGGRFSLRSVFQLPAGIKKAKRLLCFFAF
ncbi:hypothetical protein [Microbulbifer aestuariivivens]|uniref:hypothetical protein n=1 Tax=Microbulbifer aestuariivivens TaxID=1908308 RepID=UPI0031E5ED1B